MTSGLDLLTDKEKETLHLIVRGHDAKSAARKLDLSVHTINERLRNARRKLDVTSSREAARLLFESETGFPENLGYKHLGDAEAPTEAEKAKVKKDGAATDGLFRHSRFAGALLMMTLFAIGLILTSQFVSEEASDAPVEISAHDESSRAAAVQWLELVDAEDWQASFDAAGKSFRDLNTVDGWTEASRQVRVPLGAAQSRELIEMRYLNAPPTGYREARFRTRFENGTTGFETVTLEREDTVWRVVGYLIE